MSPPNSYVKTQTSNVTVLEEGDFGRYLDHKGEVLMNKISALIRRAMRAYFPSLPFTYNPGRRISPDTKSGST